MEEPNSALVKALVDLDSYKMPQFSQKNTLDYLQLERTTNSSGGYVDNRFKKTFDKTERMNKEIYTSSQTAKKAEEKEKERYKFLYGDTPEKKPSPSQRWIKKSPKQQSIKFSPSSRMWEDKKMKMKVVQKKLI